MSTESLSASGEALRFFHKIKGGSVAQNMTVKQGFNSKVPIERMYLPDSWKDIFPVGIADLKKLAERLTALCANPSETQLADLQQAREVIEALTFNYVNYDPDTHSYGVVSRPPMPSLEAVEEALGNVLRERFDKGCWDSVVYRCLGDQQNDVNWEMIMDEFAAAIKEKLFNDNPLPRMGEIVTALFQAASEMKEEEMRGNAGVRKLFRKALDITGLLADDMDSELISKVLTAEAKKRGGMLADVICIRGDTVNWEDISGELENLAAEQQVMTNNVVRRMEEFVDAVIARAAFVLKNPGFFDALETASDVAEYLVRYALCKIGCAWFYTEPLIWIEAAATDKDTQALLRGSDEDGIQGRRLLEALANRYDVDGSANIKELFLLNPGDLYHIISNCRNFLRDPNWVAGAAVKTAVRQSLAKHFLTVDE